MSTTKVSAYIVLKEGGPWLGAAREYLQCHAMRGDSLMWGSDELVHGLTVRDIEQLAADAVAADRNTREAKP